MPVAITEWDKLNEFQYRHKIMKDSFLENRNGIWIYYDKSNVDVTIPLQAFSVNPIFNPQDVQLESILGTYAEFETEFTRGLL